VTSLALQAFFRAPVCGMKPAFDPVHSNQAHNYSAVF